MSPFDWVHNNKRLMQVVLALVALPFAFWGIDSYQRVMSPAGEVAEVGGQKITEQEFAEALRQQQDRLQLRIPTRENDDETAFLRVVRGSERV